MQNHVLYADVCDASCTSVFGGICRTMCYMLTFVTPVVRVCSVAYAEPCVICWRLWRQLYECVRWHMQNHVLYADVCDASCTSVFGCICRTMCYMLTFVTPFVRVCSAAYAQPCVICWRLWCQLYECVQLHMQNHVLYADVCDASCTMCSSVDNYVRYTVHKMCSCLGYYVHLQ